MPVDLDEIVSRLGIIIKVADEYKEKNDAKNIPVDKFISELSSRFVVSSKAMEYRLKNLKIIK